MESHHIEAIATTVAVGKPAPFKVPDQEGCMLEIGYPTSGMNVMVQYPNLNKTELKSLQSPLFGYSYYESETIIPIAYWIFKFPNGMLVETNFNACLALDNKPYMENIEHFLSDIHNGISFFFLDRQIVKGIRFIGLHPEAIQLFQKTLHKQLAKKFTKEDFIITIKQMENVLSSDDLYTMGKEFKFQ
ncbi:hypothetical protein [Desulfonatronum thioautotrophicum]|uniref:hypothetical protein n=1 Tax=Desulfonatronum thioautotrophicum TaxID=617001 RepID=UPI0005EBC441|nr:hypothetical protein [Desulfonatronum thioautotrophicum]